MSDLDKALEIACKAHIGQIDKAGHPYILHPLRLMLRCETEKERIAALLHDVVEDSDYTLDDLRAAGFGEEIVEAVDCLSRRQDESYDEFIARAAANSLAKRVKIKDIQDNLDLTRIAVLSENDLKRIARYHKALAFLQRGSMLKRRASP